MDWYLYPIVVAAGFVAGFINTLAGSGSLITLPLLIFIGLPANVANGTNRVGILLQCAVSVRQFRQNQLLNFKQGLALALPSIIGAIIGANIAVNINEKLMHDVIGILMVVMLVVIILRPRKWIASKADGAVPLWLQYPIFFAIGIYGGFIQAGVGIFLLAGLMLGAGFDELRSNAVKNLIVLFFTVFALIIFIANDQVQWLVGIVLAAGSMLGAWVAVKVAVKKGNKFVRWILIAVIAVSAAKLLGIHTALMGLFE